MDIIRTQKGRIYVLTRADVEELHTLLSKNYTLIQNMDAVYPLGIKSEDLLESAVQRQYTGSGNWYKYDNCYSNCATLVFGIIKNHSFYNGNKRTGLLSMIKHLYLNGFVLRPELRHQDIYNFIKNKLPNWGPCEIFASRNRHWPIIVPGRQFTALCQNPALFP